MNGVAQAGHPRPAMPMSMPPNGMTAPSTMMMGQPPSARYDASHGPEQHTAPRPPNLIEAERRQKIQAVVLAKFPELVQAHKEGRLTPTQAAQLKVIIGGLNAQIAKEEAQRAALNAAQQSGLNGATAPPGSASTLNGARSGTPVQPPLRVETAQTPSNGVNSPALRSGVSQHSTPAAPGPPTPVAGVKRKTPPPSSENQSTHAPPGPPQPQSQSQPQDGNSAPNATQPNDSQPETEQSSSPPGDPGPQPWPMVGRESRPTLSAGLGGAPVLLSTPAHLVLPTIDAEALEAMVAPRKSTNAAAEAARKESSATSSLGSKKTIREIVATIDPRVRVDADVEDFMLEIADEFLDSVIHSACLIAQHRGSDGLDVRDLQLHLESNLNLRIPGFSSDETRVSISQSAMVGDVLLGAVGAKARVGTSSTSGGGATKSKGKGKEKGSSKDAAAAEREASLGRGLRASRIAAVRGSKKGS